MIIIFYNSSNVNIPYNIYTLIWNKKEIKHKTIICFFCGFTKVQKMYFGFCKVKIDIKIFIQGIQQFNV